MYLSVFSRLVYSICIATLAHQGIYLEIHKIDYRFRFNLNYCPLYLVFLCIATKLYRMNAKSTQFAFVLLLNIFYSQTISLSKLSSLCGISLR